MRRFLILVSALLLALPAAASAEPHFPELTGRVVDAADIIPADIEAQLTAKLEALETQSQRQLVVATVPSLDGYEISDYGYQLGRHWALGDKERDDGIMLLVAPNERKVRIEVGYGLEPIVTDGLSSLIINQQIVPRFKEGDMPGGIVSGTDALIAQLQLPPEEAQKIAAEAGQRQASDDGAAAVGGAIFLIMFLLFFVIPIVIAARHGGRRRGGMGNAVANIILWEAMKAATGGHNRSSGWGGGGGFGGGGGGFGGGGFSGGGGSFGGGGASGSW